MSINIDLREVILTARDGKPLVEKYQKDSRGGLIVNPETGEPVPLEYLKASTALATLLDESSANGSKALKINEMAAEVFKTEVLSLDSDDFDLLKSLVEKSTAYKNIVIGPLLSILRKAKVEADDKAAESPSGPKLVK
jgi:hypothetical protein